MSWIRPVVALCLAIVAVPVFAAESANRKAVAQTPGKATHQEYDRVTEATFSAAMDKDGNARFTIKGGDFLMEKVVAASGDTTLRLTQGKDVVTIALNQSGYQVARSRRTAHIDPRSKQQGGGDAIRGVLLGSQAVRSFKRLVSALEERDESEEDSPLVLGALVDGALVQMLDGDADAPKRIAKRVTRRHRAAVRAIKAKAPETFRDCIGLYQNSLLYGWDQFYSCYIESLSYRWWISEWVYRLCEWEWVIRSQQYLWQFTSCFMFPDW